MRWLLGVCLLLPTLAGCLGGGGALGPADADAAPTPEAPDGAPPAPPAPSAPPAPVRIQERIDLRDGLSETTWTMHLDGHEERRVLARLEGVAGNLVATTDYCFSLDGRLADGGRLREGGGGCGSVTGFSLGGSRTLVDRAQGMLPDGEYRFVFWSEPALGVLVLEMTAA